MEEEHTICEIPVIKELGKGSYGRVYLMEIDGENLAVKETCDKIRDLGICEPQELDILKRLDHPYLMYANQIITPEDCDDVRNLVYTMPLAFSSIRTSSSHYTLESKLKNLKQVALAIQFLHQHDILHLDIKEANVLLFGDIRDPKALLGDFGISAYAKNGVFISESNKISEPYRPPEGFITNAEGNFEWTTLSDAYSFGMMMYYILVEKDYDLREKLKRGDRGLYLGYKAKNAVISEIKALVVDVLYNLLDPDPNTRKDITWVLNHRLFSGIPVTAEGHEKKIISSPHAIFAEVLQEAISLYQEILINHKVSVFFLAIDLLYRSSSLIDEISQEILINACLELAIALISSSNEVLNYSDNYSIVQAQINIVRLLDGMLNREYLYYNSTYISQLRELYNYYIEVPENYGTFNAATWKEEWNRKGVNGDLLSDDLILDDFLSNS